MSKSRKRLLAAAAVAGAAVLFKRKRDFDEKYPLLDEYRSLLNFTMPSWIINKKCMDFINKDYEKHIKQPEGVRLTVRRIPAFDGAEILISIMEPDDREPEEILPCLVYYHGGGFVFHAFSAFYDITAEYVKQARCKLIFVNYRTVYDANADTCYEDAYSALVWTYDNAESLQIDKNKIAVGGDSAGGCLAAAVTHLTRDRKGPDICYAMLIYPVIDSSLSTQSMKKYTDVPGWNAKANRKMWSELKKSLSPSMLKYASPILDSDFTGLCNAYIEVEQFDCLHDEGVNYAEKLMKNGYKVELNDIKGTYHGYDQKTDKVFSKQILELRSRKLKDAFAKKDKEEM